MTATSPRQAMAERLTAELGDAAIAEAVLSQIGDAAARLADRIGLDAFATTELLRFTPPTAPVGELAHLVAFAFGNRTDDSGGPIGPGPVNEALAELADDVIRQWDLTVVAQWEIVEAMVEDAISIEPITHIDGTIEYLSTVGVAVAAAEHVESLTGQPIGVIGFADHVVRCCQAVEDTGHGAVVPAELALPHRYDGQSGQPWTRDRVSYLVADLSVRLR